MPPPPPLVYMQAELSTEPVPACWAVYGEGLGYSVQYLDEDKETSNWVKRTGCAAVRYPSGDQYEGDFNARGERHGRGTYLFKEGQGRYEGDYRAGKRQGQGQFKYSDGRVFTGAFSDNKRHGQGTLRYPNGDIYSGSWVQGRKDGPGTYVYADGSQLVGEWAAGTLVTGMRVFQDQSTYYGSFAGPSATPVGAGVFCLRNGNQQALLTLSSGVTL